MKISRTRLLYFAVALFGTFMLSGCMDSGDDKISSSIEFAFRVDAGQNVYRFDSTLTSGLDSLSIHKVRFVFGGDSVTVNDTTLAVIKDKSLWKSFSVPNMLHRNPIRLFLSHQTLKYSQFIFSIAKAPEGAVNIDNDFISGGHHYSLIVNGTYNGDSFTYKSEVPITKTFNFGPVNLPRYNAHYLLLIEANVLNWFTKNPGSNSGFYSPAAANTSDHLDSLFSKRIRNSLHKEVLSNHP